MPAEPEVIVTPPAEPKLDARLPESFGVKTDGGMKADIDKFFDDDAQAAKADVQPKLEVKPEPEAKIEPQPGSLAAKLAAKSAPAPKLEPVLAPMPEDPVAKLEAEMRAHNPKWKPAQGWDALKTTLKAADEKRAAVEKELEATKARLASPILAGMTAEEVESLKAREKSASDRLMVVDLESHPAFRAQYVEPKNAEIAKANELLSVHGIKADAAALLAKPRAELGKAVSELIKDVPEYDRVEIAEAIRKAHTLDQSARSALSQSKELQKGLQAKTVERQRNAFNSRWAPVSAALGEHIVELDVPANATPEQRADIEGYNADFKGLRAKAEAIALSPISEEGIAESAMKAAAYDFHIQKAMPRIIREYEEVVTLNRQLATELAALKGRNPNHGIKGSPGQSEAEPQAGRTGDPVKDAAYWFNKK